MDVDMNTNSLCVSWSRDTWVAQLCLGCRQSTGYRAKIYFVGFWAHLDMKLLVGERSSFPWGSHGLNQPSP